jgi:hypothetical protein
MLCHVTFINLKILQIISDQKNRYINSDVRNDVQKDLKRARNKWKHEGGISVDST